MAAAVILALTTEADAERAEALAQQLLERRLAACVALTPLVSLYRWQGAIERSGEVQLLIKSSADRLAELEAVVLSLHSYANPEWLHWPASAGAAYGPWLIQSCSSEAPAENDAP
jgi:periplasmic divalent cation tolerance protein